jgi:iron complex transport system substrate-binding protein
VPRRSLSLLLIPLLFVFLAACSDDSDDAGQSTDSSSGDASSLEITGTDGVTVRLSEPPKRVVSLAPHTTEVMCALGAADTLAAVDNYANCPEGSTSKPAVDSFQPSVEAITSYNPDLVYMVFDPGEIAPSLRNAGIKTLVLDVPRDLDGVFTNIEQIGRIVGKESAASHLVSELKLHRDAVVQRLGDVTDGPSYFHELDNTFFTVRSDTFVGSLYKLLKAENIADRAESPYPQLSVEAIVAANPDVIVLVDDETQASVATRPGWDTIAAVQAGRICELDEDQLSRPGPHIIEGLESLADCLYPEQ